MLFTLITVVSVEDVTRALQWVFLHCISHAPQGLSRKWSLRKRCQAYAVGWLMLCHFNFRDKIWDSERWTGLSVCMNCKYQSQTRNPESMNVNPVQRVWFRSCPELAPILSNAFFANVKNLPSVHGEGNDGQLADVLPVPAVSALG